MRTWMLALLGTISLLGCPDDDEGAAGADAGLAGDAGVSGVCAEVDCGPNGACVEVDLLPTCQCNSGFTANGLTCVAARLTDAPADFTCAAVDVQGPHLTGLTSGAFALVQNDRVCTVPQRNIFEFRANGVFVFRQQDGDAQPGDRGVILYGCWSVTEARDDRVIIAYDYGVETGRNCGWLGGVEDPPCASELAYLAADDAIWQISSEERNDERFVHQRVDPALGCVFCGEDPGCCATGSWVADFDGPLGCE